MTKPDNVLSGVAPLLTSEQLANHLQISRATIQRHVSSGMPHEKLGARAVRFRLDDVMTWLRGQAGARKSRRRTR